MKRPVIFWNHYDYGFSDGYQQHCGHILRYIYIYIDVLYFLLCVAAFQVVKLKYFLGEASL